MNEMMQPVCVSSVCVCVSSVCVSSVCCCVTQLRLLELVSVLSGHFDISPSRTPEITPLLTNASPEHSQRPPPPSSPSLVTV